MMTLTVFRVALFALGGGLVLVYGILKRRGRGNRLLLLAGASFLLLFLFLTVAEMVLGWHIPGSSHFPFPAPPLPSS